ncbi:disabled homolog 1-like isoform X2 [Ostrea edulis]|uniref:disabled homolog 1-like isoform X2 n=1 Tax=Ostrea edulis TaxID=37623 RepID=UPI0024AED0A2|nr:disabled homolog 1-like isoform X2 [Ostrea edulis]XP_056017986.1 disabled homolog 1-like isoform X2 [Ostrea edulis]XP_056017987.1 disabled homolog 1-like isoform X2 [Ostrea edulis]
MIRMSEEINTSPATDTTVTEPASTTTETTTDSNAQKKPVKKLPIDPRNDPYRFKGEGVVFNAKLIGMSDVADARGDKMCQETILAQKIAVKSSGQHKQRIIINISEEGIKLIDLRTATLLHHHPVHKISFISRDVSDRRAFGYIFGTEERTHKFFGIKTEKAAENVVLALRDLFQVVYENKKREMDAAKKQQTDDKPKEETPTNVVQLGGELATESSTDDEPDSKFPPNNALVQKEATDLSALQTELVSIEQGIQQINKMESLFDDLPSPATSSASASTSSDPWGGSTAPTANTDQNKSASSDLDELNLFSSEPAPAKKKDDIMSLFGPGAQPGFGGPQQPGFGGPQQPGFGGPQQPGFGGPQQPGFGGPQQPGFGGPQPGFGGPQPGFGAAQPQQGFAAFGQPATPFPSTPQPNPFAAQQGVGFAPPVPQRQQASPNPFGGQAQPAAPQQQNFSLFDEPVLAPVKVEDPFAAPVTTASQPKDAFADLCSIGSPATNKTPRDLFAERNAPPKKSINEMMKVPTPAAQASDPFGNVDESSLPAAVDIYSPFTCKSSDPFDTSFLKSSPAMHMQPNSALNVSASSKITEKLTLNQNYFENSDDFDLPSPQGPPPPLPNDPPPPAPPPRPNSSPAGIQHSSLPIPPPRNSENVPKTVSLSNSHNINGNTPVPRPRPRTNVTSSIPTPPPRNNFTTQEAPPKEQSTKDLHSNSFSSFTIEDPFTTNDPFADSDPFSSEGFESSGFDSMNSSDPFASFASAVKGNSNTKNGDFVSDSRDDPFAVFDNSFGDSFNFKGGSLKKKGHRKSSSGKNLPVVEPNDPFGLLVASKPVQNGSEPVYATVNKTN